MPLPPPSYTQKQIFTKSRKLQWRALDASGKLQYGYTREWQTKKQREKFCSLRVLASHIPEIIEKATALIYQMQPMGYILWLLMACHFRIGGPGEHFGITTLQKRHFDIVSRGLNVEFVGKKGVCNSCSLQDPELARWLRGLTHDKKCRDRVFLGVSASSVNQWLRENVGGDITAKSFRDLAANFLFIEKMRQDEAKVTNVIKEISQELHNTPGVLRKHYLIPDLVEVWQEHPEKSRAFFRGDVRLRFLHFLTTYCKYYSR